MAALESLRRPQDVAALRGLTIHEVLGLDDKKADEPEAAADGDAAEAEQPADADAEPVAAATGAEQES
jgi:small subunit ribosomal protein S5